MPIVQFFEKPAYNEENRTCDFSTVLESTDSIVDKDITIVDSDGVDVLSSMISDIAITPDNQGVLYKLKGGVVNKKYYMDIHITTQSDQKFVEPFVVCIT